MSIIYVLLLALFSFVIIKAADIVILALKKISQKTKTGIFALSAFLLALSTSMPVRISQALAFVINIPVIVVGFLILAVGRVCFITFVFWFCGSRASIVKSHIDLRDMI